MDFHWQRQTASVSKQNHEQKTERNKQRIHDPSDSKASYTAVSWKEVCQCQEQLPGWHHTGWHRGAATDGTA